MNNKCNKIFKNKKYVHFDVRKNPDNNLIKKIKNPNWIEHHAFYPFIHYIIKSNKTISDIDGRNNIRKNREIYYSSHIDRYIYQYYGYQLNNQYNKIAKKYGINKASIAYRNTFKGKCNIHFAKEVIDFISKQKLAFVYVSDFSKFFDQLNHKYLKEKLCQTLECDKLPNDHYKVYKSIVNFTYVERDDILSYKNIDINEFNNLDSIFDTTKEFQMFKHKYLKKHTNSDYRKLKIGIPQGSSISSVYSNIYMIDFDKQLNDYVTSNKGLYRRYCDDIVIVIPIKNNIYEYNKHIEKINSITKSIPNLNMNDKKTFKFIFKDKIFTEIDGKSKKSFNYLGFYFDGKKVLIRDKSLYKYYSRLYEKLETVCKYTSSYNRKVFRKKLYNLYSHLGAYPSKNSQKHFGNFLTYAYKSYEVFGTDNNYENFIKKQVARHWKKINNILKKCDSKLKHD